MGQRFCRTRANPFPSTRQSSLEQNYRNFKLQMETRMSEFSRAYDRGKTVFGAKIISTTATADIGQVGQLGTV